MTHVARLKSQNFRKMSEVKASKIRRYDDTTASQWVSIHLNTMDPVDNTDINNIEGQESPDNINTCDLPHQLTEESLNKNLADAVNDIRQKRVEELENLSNSAGSHSHNTNSNSVSSPDGDQHSLVRIKTRDLPEQFTEEAINQGLANAVNDIRQKRLEELETIRKANNKNRDFLHNHHLNNKNSYDDGDTPTKGQERVEEFKQLRAASSNKQNAAGGEQFDVYTKQRITELKNERLKEIDLLQKTVSYKKGAPRELDNINDGPYTKQRFQELRKERLKEIDYLQKTRRQEKHRNFRRQLSDNNDNINSSNLKIKSPSNQRVEELKSIKRQNNIKGSPTPFAATAISARENKKRRLDEIQNLLLGRTIVSQAVIQKNNTTKSNSSSGERTLEVNSMEFYLKLNQRKFNDRVRKHEASRHLHKFSVKRISTQVEDGFVEEQDSNSSSSSSNEFDDQLQQQQQVETEDSPKTTDSVVMENLDNGNIDSDKGKDEDEQNNKECDQNRVDKIMLLDGEEIVDSNVKITTNESCNTTEPAGDMKTSAIVNPETKLDLELEPEPEPQAELMNQSIVFRDYRAFVFINHPRYGLLLLHSTSKKKKGPHFQLPGGRVDKQDFLEALNTMMNDTSEEEDQEKSEDFLTLGFKICLARELYEETGIDISQNLDRLEETQLRFDFEIVDELSNEINNRFFYSLDVNDDDFIVNPVSLFFEYAFSLFHHRIVCFKLTNVV